MQQVVKAIDTINKVVGILLALMLGVMSVLIILQVISRFVINLPLTWSEELSRYLMIYIVFLGASLAMRHNKLISIELLPETLTGKKRKSVIILVMIISIIFFGILFMQGIDMLPLVQMQSSPGLQLSMAIPYASIPIGSFLLALNSLAVILDELSTKKEGES
ncbi:TRAP transporter small permease [Mesobacillus sp. AQ2]|uniref:TRAP transporter small permease n=1 Tax=Mesobacillus sp. AQ2 TaxID=3043332 RepID=UPI0024C18E73|nr:TRAP transporter small permease [Mesobacillus sp. AQ2]WHX40339.1 TRAP transporter small permease [Mesobacillus sp. AQ2]